MSWRYYEKSTPKEVKDGIKAHSKRGDIGEQWWSRRFVDVVESYSKSTRITRGKRYARKGQIVDLTVENGIVSAAVQGSQSTPYDVTIRGDALAEETWRAIEQAMADRAVFAARLLAEEMPADIEEVFEEVTSLYFRSPTVTWRPTVVIPTPLTHANIWLPSSTFWPNGLTTTRFSSSDGVVARARHSSTDSRNCVASTPSQRPKQPHLQKATTAQSGSVSMGSGQPGSRLRRFMSGQGRPTWQTLLSDSSASH